MPKYELFTTAEVRNFEALRSYAGVSDAVSVTDVTTGGLFLNDVTDLSSSDDSNNTIVDYKGRRWKRSRPTLGNLDFIQSGTGAVTRTAQDKLEEVVSVEDFGAVADWNGTTGTDNYTAFVNAIAAAITLKLPLKISGRYYIDFSTGRDRLSVSGNLVVFGTSKDISEVKFGPADVNKAVIGFDVASGANFTIRDLKLTSPTLTVYPLFDSLLAWNPVWFSPNGTTLTVERCYFGDQWHGLQVSGTGGTRPKFIFRDSYLQGYSAGLNVACSGAVQARLEAHGCTFQGHQSEGADWALRGHSIYPHPHISLVLDHCRFLGGGRAHINHFSSGAVPYTTTPPEIIAITNCYFGPCIASAILTSNLNTTTFLSNCVFDDCTGVSARCNTVVNNCEARNGGSLGSVYNSDGTNGYMTRLEFNNCCGEAKLSPTAGVASPLILTNDIDATSTGTLAIVSVNGGTFKVNGGNAISSASPKPLYVHNASFEWASSTSYGVITSVANARIVNCRFNGAFPSGTAVRNTGTGTLELIDNEFDIAVATGAVVEFNAPAGSVSGENNRLVSSAVFRAQNAQRLRFRRGRNPSTVASANNLVLDQNYDFHRISGSTTINRIRFGATDDYAKSFSDAIRLVVDTGGTWALSNSVNIVPISTGARTADEVIELYYDSSTDKWYEV